MQYQINPDATQTPAPPDISQKNLDEIHERRAKAVFAYTITALCFSTYRRFGKTREEALEIEIGAGNKSNDVLNDILDFVFNIKKAVLNDPAQSDKMRESIKEYTMQRVHKAFIDAMIESARKEGLIQ